MITYETKKAYSEIYTILQNMPSEYINKIPNKLLKLFETEKLDNYEVNINKENIIDKNYLSKKTLVLIAMLNYQYWYPNKKIKDNLYKMYLSNNSKNNEKESIYVYDIFEKTNKESMFVNEDTAALVIYKKKNFIYKLFDKIKKIFK